VLSKNLIIAAVGAAFVIAWGIALWSHWPERAYEKKKDSAMTWYWLSVLKIPRTRENCVLFVRACCVAGMVLVAVVTWFAVLTQ